MKLYEYQQKVLEDTSEHNRVAYYLDMGLGKTFVGSEKMVRLGANVNLVVCQKSKVNDWVEHFKTHYMWIDDVLDLTDKKQFDLFSKIIPYKHFPPNYMCIAIINYDLLHRRPDLLKLKNFTLMLDESSLIQNPTAKRTKTVLKMKADNVILLSGTPTDGKYERLWTQAKLLGWDISKKMYFDHYVIEEKIYNYSQGVFFHRVVGYKNVERLKAKFRDNGAVFMKTEEAIDLPTQTFQKVYCSKSKAYTKFRKSKVLEIEDKTLVGDCLLSHRLGLRQLCGMYSTEKLQAFKDLLDGTNDRLIVFYNFTEELNRMLECVGDRPVSIINGATKDLTAYENEDNSITFVQYQAGAMGLNLQKANKIIYFTLPESSALFEQSKKRIHRVGQDKPCFYYLLMCRNSIEEKIYETLEMRKDFTDELFAELIQC